MRRNVNKAYRFRIYPDKKQEEMLAKPFGCCRFLYNIMLEDKINEYKATKKMLKNTPAQYKRQFPWLKEVDGCILRTSLEDLDRAYDNFFKGRGGYPNYKKKNHNENYIWKQHIRNFFENRGLDFQSSNQNIEVQIVIRQML